MLLKKIHSTEEIKQSFGFVCADMKTMKERVNSFNYTHEKHLSCLESYTFCWNLKRYGLEKKEKEERSRSNMPS